MNFKMLPRNSGGVSRRNSNKIIYQDYWHFYKKSLNTLMVHHNISDHNGLVDLDWIYTLHRKMILTHVLYHF